MKLSSIQRELLVEVLDDWVGIWEVAKLLRDASPDRNAGDPREAAIQMIDELLQNGYFIVGDLTRHAGFVPWGVPLAKASARIDQEWRQLDRDPEIGEICWFEATDAGRLVANTIANARGAEV